MANFYLQVYNTAVKEQVSFTKVNCDSLETAKRLKERAQKEYGQIGCHEVKLFVELYPEE